MAVINHAKREINVKIVFFGPPDCGKGELLRLIHQRIRSDLRGQLKNMITGQDNLLFFDYIPFESSSLDGYRVRFYLYTMTGQVHNPGTWKMTLKGMDAVVFISSQKVRPAQFFDCFRQLRSTVAGYGRELFTLPRVWLSLGNTEQYTLPEVDGCFEQGRIYTCSDWKEDVPLKGLAALSREVVEQLHKEFQVQTELQESTVSDLQARPVCELIKEGERGVASVDELPELLVSVPEQTELVLPLLIRVGETTRRFRLQISLAEER